MDKSSLTDDSLDEVPQNRSGGENPEGDADQSVPPGRARPKVTRKYKGGRQGQGGVPNPDDAHDDRSAGSFRGTDRS